MNQAVFHLKRDHYGQDSKKRETTLAIMFDPSNNHFCYTLEDVCRPYGIKNRGETAIAATEGDFTYKMTVRNSPAYGKVVVIYTEKQGKDTWILDYGGIRFEQILAHGGNHPEHTNGCLLVNEHRDTREGHMSAWGNYQDEFVEYVEKLEGEGYDVRLRVTNLPQAS